MGKTLLAVVGMALMLLASSGHAALGIETSTGEPDMLWPLLPGESLQSLAHSLYPQSPILQQRFIQQALSYSRHRGIILQVNTPTQHAQLIAVPDAAAMHTVTRRIKKVEELTNEPINDKGAGLIMSLQMTSTHIAPTPAPPTLSRLHWREIHWPDLHLPALDTTEFKTIKKTFFNHAQPWLMHAKQAIQPTWQQLKTLGVQASKNYQANANKIAQTPLQTIYQQPQQAIILVCAVLLLVLSLVWGVLEKRKTKQ